MGLYCDLIRLSEQDATKCLELSSEEEIYALVQQNRADEDWFDIDKAWHGIHFILTGLRPADPRPFDFLMVGGTLLTDRSWLDSYGVDAPDMRVFDPGEVKAINAALSMVSTRDFRRGYNPGLMNQRDIYPRIWEKQQVGLSWLLAKYLKVSSELDYLTFHFNRLKVFLAGTAEQELGLIIKYHQ